MYLESILLPIMGILVPIIAILAGFGIAAAALKHRAKRNELEHKERMLAIEKGVALPQPVIAPAKERNPYLWGFVLGAFGLALCIGFIVNGDEQFIIWGGISLLVGVAIFLANLFHRRDIKGKTEGEPEILQEGEPVKLSGNSGKLGSA